MKIVEDFPCRFTETEECWIPLSDGIRLAAKLWLPEGAQDKPVPTILEVLPYRKHDQYAPRDAQVHRYFAGHGYASMRLDMRGSGDSGGVQANFGMVQEQDDTLEALKWIAAQPWSDGQVGMFGISWGGFQAIQAAFRSPPELKAIIPASFAPDRYEYGQVFRGGSFLVRSIRWSSQLFGYKTRPPDPLMVGETWRDMWMERLEHLEPLIVTILENQAYSNFWRERAVTDFSRIKCPIYAVSGWADASYVGAVFETIQAVDVPWKALVGPWGHRFAYTGMPGPAVGYLQECLRWFGYWMRGEDNGIMDEPKLHAWMAQDVPAKAFYPESPGRWIAEPDWPSDSISPQCLHLQPGKLADEPGPEQAVSVTTPQTLGLQAGELMPWFLHGPAAELPGDQREDDGKSLCFDSEPLTETLEILGAAEVELEIEVDQPTAFLAVRLCDVAPDGASKRVAYGILNLTHREGREPPKPLTPGKRFKLTMPLIETGYSFRPGHRVRIAISTTYWPLIWPSPKPVNLTVYAGASSLMLPVRTTAGIEPVAFEPPEAAAPIARTIQKSGGRKRLIHTDPLRQETVIEITDNAGRYRMDNIDWEVESYSTERYRLVEGDPLSASAEVTWTWIFQRGDWRMSTQTRTLVTCTETEFVVASTVDAFDGEARVFSRSFNKAIPRQGN
jgi:uncharacterized protein